jgi:hypothetical protein
MGKRNSEATGQDLRFPNAAQKPERGRSLCGFAMMDGRE